MLEETATNPVEAEAARAEDLVGVEAAPIESEAPAPEQDTPEPEFDEVEHDGQTYKVPKPLKDSFLRHADYTRKTQEVAEVRRGLEARQAEIAQQAEAQREFVKEHGRVEYLADVVADLERTNWGLYYQQNPDAAAADWAQYERLQSDLTQAKQSLQTRQQQVAIEAQRSHATRLEQAHAEVAKEITDWSPQKAKQLAEFGQSVGFSADELNGITDPRVVKVLHAAWQAHQHQQQQAKAAKVKADQAIAPAQTLRGPAGRFETAPDTSDFAAFERLADARLTKR